VLRHAWWRGGKDDVATTETLTGDVTRSPAPPIFARRRRAISRGTAVAVGSPSGTGKESGLLDGARAVCPPPQVASELSFTDGFAWLVYVERFIGHASSALYTVQEDTALIFCTLHSAQ